MDSLSDSVSKLEEIERIYLESKEHRKNEILSLLKELAILADTQAKRAVIIRELYWHNQVSVLLIKEAFGIGLGRIRKIAGTLTVEYPCKENCGRTISKIHTARSDYNYFQAEKRKRYNWHICETCEKNRKIKSEADTIDARKLRKERNQELYSMEWEDFVETPEWITIRNTYLNEVDYKCEICSLEPNALNIFLHKDTVHSQKNYYSNVFYKYYALSSKCVSRCEDLINREKRDAIKKEFFDTIKQWNREYDPYNSKY